MQTCLRQRKQYLGEHRGGRGCSPKAAICGGVLRGPGQTRPALTDPESRLENAVHLIAIYDLTRRQDALVAALVAVLQLADFDDAWPTPLLLLAQQLERLPGVGLELAYQLTRALRSGSHDVLRRVLASDRAGLYTLAAQRALESREVDRRHLGGRSGVFVAADHSGLMNNVPVFKPTTQVLADRGEKRSSKLGAIVRARGLEGRFSFPQTLARSELPHDDVLRDRNCEVLVARTFHQGQLPADYLRDHERTPRVVILESVVDILALIQGAEHDKLGGGVGRARRDLKKQEVGRWIRDGLKVDEPRRLFDEWFEAIPEPPVLSRRDAHPHNWLATSTREIVALDLEACGWRPLG